MTETVQGDDSEEGSGDKAILFDIDDTLLRTSYFERIALPYVVDAMIDAGLPVHTSHREIAVERLKQIRRANLPDAGNDFDLLCYLYNVPKEDFHRVVRAGVNRYRSLKKDLLVPHPHAIPALDYLVTEGYRLAVVTNGNVRRQWGKLTLTGLDNYFMRDRFFATMDPEKQKPNPYMVQCALEATGADPARAFLIGNTPSDIMAAHAAGIRAIRYLATEDKHSGENAISELLRQKAGPKTILKGGYDKEIGMLHAEAHIYDLLELTELELLKGV